MRRETLFTKMLNLKNYPLMVNIKRILSVLVTPLFFFLPNKHSIINYYGGKIYINLKESIMTRQCALGVYEYWKTKLFFRLIKENMTVIDVGVDRGYYSLIFAKLMNDKGKILSFEPYPDNCRWIRKSIEVNNYNSIKLFQNALSDKEEEVIFYPGKKSGWGSLYFYADGASNKKPPIVVKTLILDNILNEESIVDIDVIKIDVQGADLLVVNGAKNILKKSKKVKLIMDIDLRTEAEKRQLFEFLKSCGFNIYNIGRNLELIKDIYEFNKVLDIYAVK